MANVIVVVGASWGGLAALSELVEGLPADLPAAVVLVQHRSKDSESLLASLLQDHSLLPVVEVDDKETVDAGRIYIAPPDYHLLLDGKTFSLSVDAPVKYSRPSIDVTFVSAADAFGPRVAGVVLTGANDDGARGLRRVVDRGGLGVVQRPDTAEVATMPAAALRMVPEAEALAIAEIGPRVTRFARETAMPWLRPEPGASAGGRGVTPDALSASGEYQAVVPGDERVGLLIVDDRPENLLALEAILEPLDQRVVRANSGEEALKRLLRDEFAVILLDVQMPGINGFETAELIKARERTRNIPIIFLTAISKEDEYVFQGYEVGAVDYMSKPFNPDILRSKVAVFIDLYRKQEQLRRQEQMLRESERREIELRHRAELLESEARFAEIVHAAMDSIVTFDTEHRISLFNGAAERMFRLRAVQVVGQSVGELFPTPLRDGYVAAICEHATTGARDADGATARGEPPRVEPPRVESLTGLRGNGDEFPVEATVSSLDVGGQRLYTMIARDVSERVKAEAALKSQAVSLANTMAELTSANEELNERQLALEQAMTARNRFYASMSHELRTPINAIIGYNTLLLDNIYGPLNERQTTGLQRTHKAAKHLLELVNDILDLSKIEAGKMELALQPVSFPGVVDDLFVTVRPLADEHGSELSLEHEGEAVTLVTDPRRVRQILLNLLSNAIKFGRGKPIQIRSHPTESGGVEIAVTDQGPGISPVDLPRIFDEFVQLAQPQQHPGGTGLGLPISKRLAGLLGGELLATSIVGQGSTFRLLLPSSLDTGKRSHADNGHESRAARAARETTAKAS